MLALWLGAAPRHDVPEATAAMYPEAPRPPAPPVRFPDGSFAELHGAASRVYTEEFSADRVRLRLSGSARFHVAPSSERKVSVSSGRVVVRGQGATFDLAPDGLRTRVSVEQGRVQVMWQRGATLLPAGMSVVFPPDDEL